MASLINRLAPRFPATVTDPGWHHDGGGLHLRVDSKGGKRWVYVFQWRGKRREMGLGGARSVTLAAARKAATEARQMVGAGLNPIEERARAKRVVPTFGEFADEYVDAQAPGWRNAKHVYQWRFSVEKDAAALRRLPVNEITTDDVLGVLKPIWALKPETAKRCRGRIERILDAAKARGFRAGENPARWGGHLALMLPKPPKLVQGHLPAMAIDKLPAFLARLRLLPGSSARALEFTILTAARTNEVLGARWCEIDFAQRIWTVPGGRMKPGVVHRVPLSNRAVAILLDVRSDTTNLAGCLPEGDGFIFLRRPTDLRLSNMAMEMLLRRMKVTDACVHGFRSTFRDWAGERTEHPRELVEISLSHLVGSEVERAYRRGDALERRRKMMEGWSKFCSSPNKEAVEAAA